MKRGDTHATAEALEEYKMGVKSLKSEKWIPAELKTLPSRCIQINVGGLVSDLEHQMF